MRPTAVSLFAGVGGIDLALERAGFHVTAAVEIDKAARGVLADRLPHTTLFDDVTEVSADDLRATGFVPQRGIVAAGWPCQGNSVAGRRGGLADPRSGLWRHVVRLLAELNPRWFLGENVPGLLSVTEGEDFGVVVQQLAELGYGFGWRVLDAQYFGVPQRRPRVFVVGRAGDTGAAPAQILLEPEGGDRNPSAGQAQGPQIAATLTSGSARAGVSAPGRRQEDDVNLVVSTLQGGGERGYRIDAEAASGGHLVCVTGDRAHALTSEGADASEDGTGRGTPIITCPTLTAGMGTNAGHPGDAGKDDIALAVMSALTARCGNTQDDQQTGQLVTAETDVRRLTPLECERLQGFPDGWTATSNGKPQADSARYRQMGNAVAVPVVEWIARRIAALEVPT